MSLEQFYYWLTGYLSGVEHTATDIDSAINEIRSCLNTVILDDKNKE